MLCKSILENCNLDRELRLFDIGCSYGTLLLQAKDYLERFYKEQKGKEIKVYAYGCDNSLQRITLGAGFIKDLIDDGHVKDLANFRTLIFHQNILERASLEQIDFIYMYDKAFDPFLLIHCLLIAIKSKDVKWIMTCKKSGWWKKQLRFDFQDVIKKTNCFKELHKIGNIKMSGSGESDTFIIYQKNHDVNNEFLTSQVKTREFLRTIGVHDALHDEVITTYFGKGGDNFEVFERHSYSSSVEWNRYYKKLADVECLQQRDSKRACQLHNGPVNYSDTRRRKKLKK